MADRLQVRSWQVIHPELAQLGGACPVDSNSFGLIVILRESLPTGWVRRHPCPKIRTWGTQGLRSAQDSGTRARFVYMSTRYLQR